MITLKQWCTDNGAYGQQVIKSYSDFCELDEVGYSSHRMLNFTCLQCGKDFKRAARHITQNNHSNNFYCKQCVNYYNINKKTFQEWLDNEGIDKQIKCCSDYLYYTDELSDDNRVKASLKEISSSSNLYALIECGRHSKKKLYKIQNITRKGFMMDCCWEVKKKKFTFLDWLYIFWHFPVTCEKKNRLNTGEVYKYNGSFVYECAKTYIKEEDETFKNSQNEYQKLIEKLNNELSLSIYDNSKECFFKCVGTKAIFTNYSSVITSLGGFCNRPCKKIDKCVKFVENDTKLLEKTTFKIEKRDSTLINTNKFVDKYAEQSKTDTIDVFIKLINDNNKYVTKRVLEYIKKSGTVENGKV